MMTGMNVAKSDIARAGATPEFVKLCKTLYGPIIDPDVVWDTVIKASPDQADLSAKAKSRQLKATGRTSAENIALATNTLGVVAAPSAVAGAYKLARQGERGMPFRGAQKLAERREAKTGRPSKVARGLRSVAARSGKGRLVAAGLGTGAVGLQLGNASGDAISAHHFSKPKKVETSKAVSLGSLVDGNRKIMNGMLKPTAPPKPQGVPKFQTPPAPGAKPAQAPPKPDAGKHRAATADTGRHRSEPGGGAASRLSSTAAGRDVGRFASTRTGQGVMAVGGLQMANSANNNRQNRAYGVPAYYGKADERDEVTFAGEFSKFDDDKRLAFGWASVVEINGSPVVDKQGDYISADDLEEAAYTYVHKSRVGGDMHKRTQSLQGDSAHKVSDLVESIVFTDDKVSKLGLPDDFPRGWWVGYKVHDEDTWQMVRSGERTGFSIHGKGIRKEASMDEVMGY